MDLKDHIYLIRDRLQEKPSVHMTYKELAEHFGKSETYIASCFSRSPRVFSLPILRELAKIVKLTKDETQAMLDAWVEWRHRRGPCSHFAETTWDHVLPSLPPKKRREMIDRYFADEEEAAENHYRNR